MGMASRVGVGPGGPLRWDPPSPTDRERLGTRGEMGTHIYPTIMP